MLFQVDFLSDLPAGAGSPRLKNEYLGKGMGGANILSDKFTSLEELRNLVASFVEARQWQKFHTPKNLAMSVAIEAAELMELFQWSDGMELDEEHLGRVREELADVVIYCLTMANTLDIDLSRAVRDKVAVNERKYPIERYKGRYK